MPSSDRMIAWIEQRGGDCVAAFVAESTAERRAPAVRQFASRDEARRWVIQEADAVQASVEWVTDGAVRVRPLH
jgi:hypothetical protein